MGTRDAEYLLSSGEGVTTMRLRCDKYGNYRLDGSCVRELLLERHQAQAIRGVALRMHRMLRVQRLGRRTSGHRPRTLDVRLSFADIVCL
jgi:hypothetical protein